MLNERTLLAVQDTIEELRLNYKENVSIEELALRANIGTWQYRQLFKRLTGQNPVDFMTEIRINRSKELLLQSSDKLVNIARSVGYQDEYYFNRRFKQTVGCSPRQYIRTGRSKFKIASFSHLGDLLALSASPVAAEDILLNWLDPVNTAGITGIGSSEEGIRGIAQLHPDLILVNEYTNRDFTRELRNIAPTVAMSPKSDMFDRLKELASLLGRQQEEQDWLSRYASKSREARSRWSWMMKKETAVVFHVVNNSIYLHRPEEMPVLYDVLGFQVPSRLNRLIATHPSRLFIPPGAFADYAADVIFITCGQMSGAKETLAQLTNDPQWAKLDAVRSGRVYRLDPQWMLDGSIALEWQLDGLEKLFSCRAK